MPGLSSVEGVAIPTEPFCPTVFIDKGLEMLNTFEVLRKNLFVTEFVNRSTQTYIHADTV